MPSCSGTGRYRWKTTLRKIPFWPRRAHPQAQEDPRRVQGESGPVRRRRLLGEVIKRDEALPSGYLPRVHPCRVRWLGRAEKVKRTLGWASVPKNHGTRAAEPVPSQALRPGAEAGLHSRLRPALVNQCATGCTHAPNAMVAVPAASDGGLGRGALAWTVSMPFCRVRRGRKIAPKWEPG
jgi:hypothetical protein